MNDPTMASLEDKCANRFELVVAVAVRSKQLKEGARPLVDCGSRNPITVAMHEISQGKLKILHDVNGETQVEEVAGPSKGDAGPAEEADAGSE